ncbi:MAG: hypothetical protein ACREWE_00340 [Gammaproteobacteria bacterium]
MTAKRANAALEGGGVDYRPRLGFVYFVHIDVGPVRNWGEVALADGPQWRLASSTRRRRRDGRHQGLSGPITNQGPCQ